MLVLTVVIAMAGAFAHPAVGSPVGLSESSRDVWVPNGSIRAMVRHGDRLYVGGDFQRFGPMTGAAASFDVATGVHDARLPVVDDEVTASAADGHGGWYIGGTFEEIEGQPRAGLAHLTADGSLDPAWHPSIPKGSGAENSQRELHAIVRRGDRVYIGGHFFSVDGVPRRNLAAVDAGTGAVDPTWKPDPDDVVSRLRVSGDRVYALGVFQQISGVTREYAAALDALNGAATSWDVGDFTKGPPEDLAVDGNRIYLAGRFETVNGVRSDGLVAVDDQGGAIDQSWRPPRIEGSVYGVVVVGGRVVIGGSFSSIGNVRQTGLAAFDTATAALAPGWEANTGGIHDLVVAGDRVYAGGEFRRVGTTPRDNLVAVDPETGQVDSTWISQTGNQVKTLATSGDRVFAGGWFTTVNGVVRNHLAALDADSGQLDLDWQGGSGARVDSLAVSRDRLYATTGSLGGIQALQLPDGSPLATFHPAITDPRVLAADGARLYIGGSFDTNGRKYLAALDLDTGALDPRWNTAPGAPEFVNALIATPGRLHVVGNLMSSFRRPSDGAFDGGGGSTESIETAAVVGNYLYLGGRFQGLRVNGKYDTDYPYLARVDRTTGQVDPDFKPKPDAEITHLSRAGSKVVIGGYFSSISGQPRQHIAVLDGEDQKLDPWAPKVGRFSAADLMGKTAFVGGDSQTASGHTSAFLSVFCCQSDATLPPLSVSAPVVTGNAAIGESLSCDTGEWRNSPTTYRRRWLAGSTEVGQGASYTVRESDAGKDLTCEVVAANSGGELAAESVPKSIPAPPPAAPSNTAAPSISGSATNGSTLHCDPGTWTGGSGAFTYVWLRGSSTVGTGADHLVSDADEGQGLVCRVRATGSGGESTADSAPVTVATPLPANTLAPAVSGQARAGNTLSCTPGEWTGARGARSYTWLRDGVAVATGRELALAQSDAGHSFVCRETVANAGGSQAADSQAVAVLAQDPPPEASPPHNVTPPVVAGRPQPGEALSCQPGTWDSGPHQFDYTWLRDGQPVATGLAYAVTDQEVGATLSCTEKATNDVGSVTAPSAGVTVKARAADPPPTDPEGPPVGPGPEPSQPAGPPTPTTIPMGNPGLGAPVFGAASPARASPRVRALKVRFTRHQMLLVQMTLTAPTTVSLKLARCAGRGAQPCSRLRSMSGRRRVRRPAGSSTVRQPLRWGHRALGPGRYVLRVEAGKTERRAAFRIRGRPSRP